MNTTPRYPGMLRHALTPSSNDEIRSSTAAIPWHRRIRTGLAAMALLMATTIDSDASTRGVYVGNEFYAPTTTWQTNARNSNFTSLFLFTLQVNPNGDLRYNDRIVVQNGSYVGDSTWGAKLAACKGGSVNRIEMCIGNWGSTSFDNIRDLVASQGTGTGSILYRNFLALKNAIGIDAIQYDDEKTYHADSAVALGSMLSGMGLKVTLCPYTAQSFWVNVKSRLGSKVDAIYLQCYDGGAGNDPKQWTDAFGGFRVQPGLWGNTTTSTDVPTKMRNWQRQFGITGGFMWLNGSLPGDAPKWGQALINGLDYTGPISNGTYALFARHSNKALGAQGGGTGNSTQLVQSSYNGTNSMRWTSSDLGAGQYRLTGLASGRSINVEAGATGNDAKVILYDWRNENNSKYTVTGIDSGYYVLAFVHSGRAMTVHGASTGDGASIIQYYNNQGTNAQWQFRTP